jgi:hypothetical protein
VVLADQSAATHGEAVFNVGLAAAGSFWRSQTCASMLGRGTADDPVLMTRRPAAPT